MSNAADSPPRLAGYSADQAFQLDLEDRSGLLGYLVARRLAEPDEPIAAQRAGEGNMNCVIRVHFPNRSLILKQAHPWVEKYPSISAPMERAAVEARFYRFAAQHSAIAAMMPRLIDFDENSALLILEDLSPASTLADCYGGRVSLDRECLTELGSYLSTLHRVTVPPHERTLFRNEAMRRLNHEHIFEVPLRTDGVLAENLNRITPGLYEAGEPLRRDRRVRQVVESLGERYRDCEGTVLIHGDFFPGSLLRTGDGRLRVFDPEFCFCGDPEFDIGVFCAHLVMSAHQGDLVEFWLETALKGRPHSKSLTLQYAGVEILRRILGVAQLPIARWLEFKVRMLERSRELLYSS